MSKAAATLGLELRTGLEAGIGNRGGEALTVGAPRGSRLAAAWRHRRELDRQRAELSKSHDAALGRDTGCRC
jgi:hypothetical protein